jgi:hypothetical protein
MSKYDIKARIVKTGEERIYPEVVFNNICDDTENPLQFIGYVDQPTDNMPMLNQQPQPEIHSQLLIDEVIRLRDENNKLKASSIQIEQPKAEEQPEKKRGRPTKEVAA